MDAQPIYVFAKWQVREGELTNVLSLLAEATQKSQAEPGNLFYKVHQSTTDAHTLVLFEGYADESAVNAHRNSAHFQSIVVGQIVPLLDNREVVVTTAI